MNHIRQSIVNNSPTVGKLNVKRTIYSKIIDNNIISLLVFNRIRGTK
jgi:hypothetical protein